MAQQFDYPKTETQLREIQDKLYQHSKEVHDAGGRPAFKGLLEIMSAKATIITAIHNIKSNHGSETPGVDSKTMRKDYLQRSYSWVIKDIQKAFEHFEPQKIRRVYIDKPGKAEKRPLGIPTIRDRIVQECMRIVLEPIFEAQFFSHSYGFRPMRDTAMALERINFLTHSTGYRVSPAPLSDRPPSPGSYRKNDSSTSDAICTKSSFPLPFCEPAHRSPAPNAGQAPR